MKLTSKKLRLLIGAVSIIILLTVGVFVFQSLKSKPIKIGYVASLSGINAELGISGRNGAMLAVDNINKAGGINGRTLSLEIKNDENNIDSALLADQAFLSEGINLIIGHMTSQMAEKTVPFVNENHMLMLSPTIAVDSLSGQDDHFFRVIPSNKTQAWAISEQMKSQGLKKVGVVIDDKNSLFSTTLRDFFIEYFEASGGEVIQLHDIISTETNSEPEICDDCIEIISTELDGLFIISGADGFASYAQILYQNGVSKWLYGPAWAMTVDVLARGGKSIEGARFVNYINYESTEPYYEDFYSSYLEAYNVEPSFASILAYEAVSVLATAIRGSGSSDPDAIADYIEVQKTFDGLDCTLEFDQFGDMKSQLYIYEVTGNQFHLVYSGKYQ